MSSLEDSSSPPHFPSDIFVDSHTHPLMVDSHIPFMQIHHSIIASAPLWIAKSEKKRKPISWGTKRKGKEKKNPIFFFCYKFFSKFCIDNKIKFLQARSQKFKQILFFAAPKRKLNRNTSSRSADDITRKNRRECSKSRRKHIMFYMHISFWFSLT
jgi:hypothetical protein